MEIVLYTLNCPKCKVLELKLKQKNIEFTTVSDQDTVINVGKEHEINSAPILQVGDTFYSYLDAVSFVNGR